jgi:hypothetical protein
VGRFRGFPNNLGLAAGSYCAKLNATLLPDVSGLTGFRVNYLDPVDVVHSGMPLVSERYH